MYSKLSLSLLFAFVIISTTLGEDINSNDVDARYMISQFNGDEFPIAIDTCNPLDITGANGHQTAVCNDESSLTWKVWADSDCSAYTGISYDLNATLWQTGTGTYWDFNCNEDSVDAYAAIAFSIGSCSTSSFVTMHAALDVCTLTGPYPGKSTSDFVSLSVYCEPGWAELQYYDSSTTGYVATCSEDYLYQIANATDECGFMLQTSGTRILGYVDECVGSGINDTSSSGDTTTTEDSSDTTTTDASSDEVYSTTEEDSSDETNKTRYMISQFDGAEFPMAIDTCNPLEVTGTAGYQTAECNDDETLTWKVWADSDCSAYTGVSYDLNATWQTGTGTFWDFNCDSSYNDTYAEIEFGSESCDSTSFVTMHAAVGVCTLIGPYDEESVSDWVSLKVYCEHGYAKFDFYDSSTSGYTSSCSADYLLETGEATGECGVVYDDIVGYITDCVGVFVDDESNDDISTTTTTSAALPTTTNNGNISVTDAGPTTTGDNGGKNKSKGEHNVLLHRGLCLLVVMLSTVLVIIA